MAAKDFLRNRVEQMPTIYAYELVGVPDHEGLIKVGFTVRDVEERIKEQLGTANVKHRTLLKRNAMRPDGSVFDDHAVHKLLRNNHVPNPEGEWFRCDVRKVEQAIENVRQGRSTMTQRTVKALDEKYIIVNFGREDKKFLFPGIFEKEFMFVIQEQ